MFRFLENTFTSFKRLGLQQEPASRDANSSRNTIKLYKEDELWLAGILESSRYDPSSVPKVFRPKLLVAEIDLLTPRDTPYVAKPWPIDMQGGLGPLFSKLPGEIRNIIYSDLLSSGHPQFLRASKAIHLEGSSLVQEKGIHRMKFGFSNSVDHDFLSQRAADTIRHLDIRANVSDIGGPLYMLEEIPDICLLRAFSGPSIRRGVCNVSFELYPDVNHMCVNSVCRSLRLLSGFEKVIVRVKIDRRASSPLTKRPVLILHRILDRILAEDTAPVHWSDHEFREVYDFIRKELERYLGKPYFRRDEHGLYMVFHPRKALEGLGNEY